MSTSAKVIQGDCLKVLKKMPDRSVDCVVTSPPYFGLRDYGTGSWKGGNKQCSHQAAKLKSRYDYAISKSARCGTHKNRKLGTDAPKWKPVCPSCGAVRVDKQVGTEQTMGEYVEKLVAIFRETRRVLKDGGTVWINLGDSYLPNKSEALIPQRISIALFDDGWIVRQTIIWEKPNPCPDSAPDRCTRSHEFILCCTKFGQYCFDKKAIEEPAVSDNDGHPIRKRHSVWVVPTKPYRSAHFATYPVALITPCILAGCPPGGVVLDPFAGSGTTGVAAALAGRNSILIELNSKYAKLAKRRIAECVPMDKHKSEKDERQAA